MKNSQEDYDFYSRMCNALNYNYIVKSFLKYYFYKILMQYPEYLVWIYLKENYVKLFYYILL